MLRIITQKCPCGYVYERETKIEKKDLCDDKSICFRTGEVGLKYKETANITITESVTKGDEPFEPLIITPVRKDYSMLVCPKCGTVLLASRVTKIVEEEKS